MITLTKDNIIRKPLTHFSPKMRNYIKVHSLLALKTDCVTPDLHQHWYLELE